MNLSIFYIFRDENNYLSNLFKLQLSSQIIYIEYANFIHLEANSDIFADDKDGERLPDLQGHETNSDVSERDTNEVDIQETSNVLACGTDELSSQDPDQTNSGVLEHEKDVVPLQHGEAERFSSSENDIQNTEKSIKKML